jgi:hypothetical protein
VVAPVVPVVVPVVVLPVVDVPVVFVPVEVPVVVVGFTEPVVRFTATSLLPLPPHPELMINAAKAAATTK